MTTPRNIDEAFVHGRRLVRPGDKVKLLPIELREKDEEAGDYFAQQEFAQQREWYGNGPFTITEISEWPCGQIMLYIKGGKAEGAGVYAEDFM